MCLPLCCLLLTAAVRPEPTASPRTITLSEPTATFVLGPCSSKAMARKYVARDHLPPDLPPQTKRNVLQWSEKMYNTASSSDQVGADVLKSSFYDISDFNPQPAGEEEKHISNLTLL